MNTAFHPGREWTKEERKKLKELRMKKNRVKKVFHSQEAFQNIFLKSWLIEPSYKYSPRILSTLSNPSLSFTERYNSILFFNKINEIERAILEKMRSSSYIYGPCQHDCLRAYRANQKLRWQFKRLVLAWKCKKAVLVNEEDIISLEVPKKPVYIFDFSSNKKYQFEAKFFLIDSVNRFLLHDDFFPISKYPRNILTNEDLTFGQAWSISNQLHSYGITHWSWEGFQAQSFSLEKFRNFYEIPLKYEMVKRCFHDTTSSDAKYFTSELILAFTSGCLTKILRWAVYQHPLNSYVLRWRELCRKYWHFAVLKGEEAAENEPFFVNGLQHLLDESSEIEKLRTLWKISNKNRE
jgi:hypothetical protein